MPHHAADPAPLAEAPIHAVTFLRHGDLYAVRADRVLSVILACEAVRLFPLAQIATDALEPRCVRIRVVDLGRPADGAPAGEAREQQLLVCRDESAVVGFLIDEIQGLKRLRRCAIHPASGAALQRAPGHAVGVASIGHRQATVLDVCAACSRDSDRFSLRPDPLRERQRDPADPAREAPRAGDGTHAAR